MARKDTHQLAYRIRNDVSAIFFIGRTPLGRGEESGQELELLPIAISYRYLLRAP